MALLTLEVLRRKPLDPGAEALFYTAGTLLFVAAAAYMLSNDLENILEALFGSKGPPPLG